MYQEGIKMKINKNLVLKKKKRVEVKQTTHPSTKEFQSKNIYRRNFETLLNEKQK